MIWKPPLVKAQTALENMAKTEFSIWQMELLHPAMLWLHPAMWHVALESWQWIHQVAAPCNVISGSGMTCHWIRPVAAPCNVADGSGITCHGIRQNVRHTGILHLVSILTISPQSTCHSFWESSVFFCILATDRLTNKRTDGQHQCTKPLSLSRVAA